MSALPPPRISSFCQYTSVCHRGRRVHANPMLEDKEFFADLLERAQIDGDQQDLAYFVAVG